MNCSFNTAETSASPRAGSNARRLLAVALSIVGLAAASQAQEVLLRETFESDGEGTRYDSTGVGVVNKNGQVVPVPGGPSYWARNTAVIAAGEVVGVPFPAPARRGLVVYHANLDPATLTKDGMRLMTNMLSWLAADNTNTTKVAMFSGPQGAPETALGDLFVADILRGMGYSVIDDDTSLLLPEKIAADKVGLIISSGGGDPIRLTGATVPLLCYNEAITGDMLLATSGDVVTIDPGTVKTEAAAHAVAAGLPATFSFVNAGETPLNTIGGGLPPGSVTVASYQLTDAGGNPQTRAFAVATEKGVQLLGGLISGMEGTGFWAGADLNEPNISDPPRTITLRPKNVTGKTKLKLSFLLAGTEVDFEGPGGADHLSIKVDLGDGNGFIEVARYGSPTGAEKFLVETIKGGDGAGGPPELFLPDYTKRVGIVAKRFTYDIPNATQLQVQFSGDCTFWNEIFGFDDIQVTSGDTVVAPPTLAYTTTGGEITFTWTGDFALEKASALSSTATGWAVVPGAVSGYKTPMSGGAGMFRLKSK